MTLTQINYIIAVDTYRHFATAAEKSFVTQPTLSMQIQKLEDELGVLIFDRSKHPIKPTEIGKKIIEQARTIKFEADKVYEIIAEGKGEVFGEFRLGVIPTIASTLLPKLLKNFSNKYPKIELIVEELQTDEIVDKLKKDTLDAAIAATPLHESKIIEKPLYYEPFMAYVPEGHRLFDDEFVLVSELDINDILLLNRGHCFRNNVVNLCDNAFNSNKKSNLKLESGNFDTLIKLAHQGFGMTLIPYLYALELDNKYQKYVKHFDSPKPTREVSIIYNQAQSKLSVINALADEIVKVIPKNLSSKKQSIISPL